MSDRDGSTPFQKSEGREAATVAHRIEALLKRHGLGNDTDDANDPQQESGVSDVYAASILGRVAVGPRCGQRLKTGGDCVDAEDLQNLRARRCPVVSGYSLHADVAVPGGDRQWLARLIRYVARPPLCSDRMNIPKNVLEVRGDPVDGGYTRFETLEHVETVSPRNFPDISFPVDEILG